MPTLHFQTTTTSTPEQFIAGLTDFGPGRSKIFPNSADGDLKVHDQGPTEADVTEGSRGVWERLVLRGAQFPYRRCNTFSELSTT